MSSQNRSKQQTVDDFRKRIAPGVGADLPLANRDRDTILGQVGLGPESSSTFASDLYTTANRFQRRRLPLVNQVPKLRASLQLPYRVHYWDSVVPTSFRREIDGLVATRNVQGLIAFYHGLSARLDSLDRGEGDPNDTGPGAAQPEGEFWSVRFRRIDVPVSAMHC